MASENLQLTSARFVKEIAFHSGKIDNFVPDHVIKNPNKTKTNFTKNLGINYFPFF